MTEKKRASGKRRKTRRVQWLLCDPETEGWAAGESGEAVRSPILCLAKAVEQRPELLAVHFSRLSPANSGSLVELCTALKHLSATKEIAVAALLHFPRRSLLKDLLHAGVDYGRDLEEAQLTAETMAGIAESLSPEDRLDRALSRLCPFIRFTRIDALRELTVCGAYLDRMVLGSRRLHELCETERHVRCDYFLQPRQNETAENGGGLIVNARSSGKADRQKEAWIGI